MRPARLPQIGGGLDNLDRKAPSESGQKTATLCSKVTRLFGHCFTPFMDRLCPSHLLRGSGIAEVHETPVEWPFDAPGWP